MCTQNGFVHAQTPLSSPLNCVGPPPGLPIATVLYICHPILLLLNVHKTHLPSLFAAYIYSLTVLAHNARSAWPKVYVPGMFESECLLWLSFLPLPNLSFKHMCDSIYLCSEHSGYGT